MYYPRSVTSLEHLLSFELAPLPSAIFDDYADLRRGTKSQLFHKHAVWGADDCGPDATIIDGNEMLYSMTWQKLETAKDLLQKFIKAVECDHKTIVVFDRKIEGSIKTHECLRRSRLTSCPALQFTLTTISCNEL